MNTLANRIRQYRLLVIATLVSGLVIAPALLLSANASGNLTGGLHSAEGAKGGVPAQAKEDKDANLCRELQPCVTEKLESIDATLHDISGLIATVAFADPKPLPLGTFINKQKQCERDTYNAFFNNTGPGAAAKEVSFYIKNAGTCPVELSVSATRGGAPAGGIATLDIPSNNNDKQGERASFNVPAAMFLRAKCDGSGDCNYVINEVRP